MVFFKRKPVQYISAPIIEDEDAEVWTIARTGEYFIDYEAYLNRIDFYQQRRFICQITGHSGLTFFEALKSETEGAREVEESFPEALKGPVLRSVQFSVISRIDNLVDAVFDDFKKDYYPGEAVTVHVVTGERLTGVVRDKTRFGGGKIAEDGTISGPYVRYFVSLDSRPTEEAVVDDNHIMRDRKIFTKQILRSFIKRSVTRESWTGAPWLVKPEYAKIYQIDTRVPPHLRHENKVAEKKQSQALKKAGTDFEGMVSSFSGGGSKLVDIKPAPKSHKSKAHQLLLQQQQQQGTIKVKHAATYINGQTINNTSDNSHQYLQGPSFQAHTFHINGGSPTQYDHQANFQNQPFSFAPLQAISPLPPPPPPIKYPIEDLQVAPRKDSQKRPQLKYFAEDTPVPVDANPAEGSGIRMESVGLLLETWDTLNVYCEIFKLDSFTFDDFVQAMQFTSEDVECELFVEIHCAALKLLVSAESEGGKVQIQLPELESDSDEEDSEDDTSAVPTPSPEPEPQPKGRTTRSSLAKMELANGKEEAAANNSPEAPKLHLADDLDAAIEWIEKLRKREFKNGGWQVIVVGLLNQLSKNPRHQSNCESLLQHLVPVDQKPSQALVKELYANLDINLRIKALQIVCILTAQTKAIRGFMEECSEQMTSFRKEKIQWQRDRKQALEELRLLNEERKIQLPANMIPSPEPEQIKTNEDVKMTDTEDIEIDGIDDETIDSEDEIHQGRSLRRGNDRAAERQRKREVELERKEKAEAAAKLPKQTKQFTKLLKDIQKKQEVVKDCEEEIAILDNDLREADCPRTRVLGKDRFWNRYYWFERNGMPYAGLPNSSTADAGYANGCIWIQGPDDIEREGYIDLKEKWESEYVHKFNMTVPERKKLEEGHTSVYNAHQWGYYDTPEDVDKLITWLDSRGSNELKLQKELKNYRDKIVHHMEKRVEYLNPVEDKKDEPSLGKRMSTRKHQHEEQKEYRCLLWHNNTALEDLGHLHADQPRARKPTRKEKMIAEERETRSESKSKKQKVLGRQGSRYEF